MSSTQSRRFVRSVIPLAFVALVSLGVDPCARDRIEIPGLSDEQNRAMAQAYVDQARQAFYEDVAIWDSKIRIDNPLLCEGDGPIYQMRDWYQQFYTDVEQVRPASVARRVFELNPGKIEPPALRHVFEG